MPYALKNDKNFRLKPPLGKFMADTNRPYREFPEDYVGNYQIDDLNQVGVCEIQGRRRTQEDVLAINHEAISAFKNLDREQQKIAYISTFDNVQKKYCEYPEQGSTACVVTTWIDRKQNKAYFATGNLGDSTGILILMNGDNKIIKPKSKRLNKLHKPSEAEEEQNIYFNDGFVIFDRLGGVLSLSRAFGDTQFGEAISHSPDIFFDEENLDEGVKAFVLVACDGLEEHLSETDIFDVIEANAKQSPDVVAYKLVQAAYQSGSGDNISVAFAPISETCTSIAIFDGHGGAEVSHALGDHFYDEFVNEITAVQTPKILKEKMAQYDGERIKKEKEKRDALERLQQISAKIKEEGDFQTQNIRVSFNEPTSKYTPPRIFIESNDDVIIKRLRELAVKLGLPNSSNFCNSKKQIYYNSFGVQLQLNSLPDINLLNQFYTELHKIGLDLKNDSFLQSQSIFKQAANSPSDSIENKFESLRLGN